MDDRVGFDDAALDRNDERWEESQRFFRLQSTLRMVESLVTEKIGQRATWVSPLTVGGYNNLYRMRIEESADDVIIRPPQPHRAQFPEEKTLREAATTIFVAEHTSVPVPRMLSYGLPTPDSQIGPFIIMEYVENSESMRTRLRCLTRKISPNLTC